MSDKQDFKIWEGIQDHWPEEKAEIAFSDMSVLDKMADRVRETVRLIEEGQPDERSSVYAQYPLSILVAALSTKKPLVVIDFGGGLGQTFLTIKAASPQIQNLDYHVVEFPELTEKGNEIFADDDMIHFVDDLEKAPGTCDILFAGSAFQYVDKWEELLERFNNFNPDYIVFGNLLAGDIDSLVTFQNNYGHKIPVRFHNYQQICTKMEGLGFKETFSAFHEQVLLGKKQKLPLGHFPEGKRLSYGRNVIFERQPG